MREQFTHEHYLTKVLGAWSKTCKGWYTQEALDRCIATGVQRGT